MYNKFPAYNDNISQSMKQSKIDELYADIKLLTRNNKYRTIVYLELKDLIKQFKKEYNDKALQEIFFFIASVENNMRLIEIAQVFRKQLEKHKKKS